MTDATPQTGYAPVNDLEMYYEVHGVDEADRTLVLLHGAYMTIDAFSALLPGLAATRQVIAPEFQAHGHTADADRPLSYEQMADDTAALLRHIGVENADVFGYSMGGGVSLQLAIRHPELVRKLVSASASYTSDGMHPELLAMFPNITPEMFAGSPMEAAYRQVAPNPEDFPKLVEKLKQLDMTPFAWPPENIQGITAPTLLIMGDSDAIRLEHAVEMFTLLGGGVMGDLAGLPNAQLAVLPGTTHVGVIERADWLLSMIGEFLDAPMPENDTAEGGAQSSSEEPESDLPSELARPARRALTGAGYVRLEQFISLREADVRQLHGMGPKALDQIRRALAARGQSFADGREGEDG